MLILGRRSKTSVLEDSQQLPTHAKKRQEQRRLLLVLGMVWLGALPAGTVPQEELGFDSEREPHQPIVLYVSGIPLHVVIGPRSEALDVGQEQCMYLLEQDAIGRDDLDRCCEEFARSLRPHIAELREVNAAHRASRAAALMYAAALLRC